MFYCRGMADPAGILAQRTAALAVVAARVPGGVAGLTCARDADVVDLVATAQAVVASAQGILAAAAGEIARRSQGKGVEGSLARRLGDRSAKGLVTRVAAVPFPEASRAVDVGEMIRANTALSGEDLPADRVRIAEAVLAGELSLVLAHAIDEAITKVAHRLIGDQAEQLERHLVARAVSRTWSVQDFLAYCHRIPNLLDPDGAEGRDQRLRDKASVRESRLGNGMLRIVAELDPEREAYYRAAMAARTNPHRPDDGAAEGVVNGPDRTQPDAARSKLEAFVSIFRGALRAEDGRQAGVDTTILVRIDLDALLTGLGTATIDGIGEPISAASARRMAAEADLIPQVLDGKSQLLDQGEAQRFFTKAQRYAILAAYSGCAFPQCGMPSSMCEIHHIGSWATRHRHRHGTDLDNGIPLCGFHNRLMERGWEIEFDTDRVPWFRPPSEVDWGRRLRRGGTLADGRAA